MKFHVIPLLFFLPAVFGWWNCELPTGRGDSGRCIEDGDSAGYSACTEDHPCIVQGNGCSPIGSRLAHCS
ncbi:hypothetical protein BGZ61DRAFT_458456 [Ilyonectria robusta]|uniref:uncharacterized protein n=1 Tax=Ilyonectria robusta TaxID=1079257 RepID=UPI001E8D95AC|nr:uncharacterized protein BGZ61DRAFT_458456 [Ilyonectria robusta]KAH8675213.1 hypothetical protein BGZ61DRAFT_458456 [Ilyonectria robusta]